jgi:hypothetical protein
MFGYWSFDDALDRAEAGLQLARKLSGRPDSVFIDLHREGEELSLLRIAAFLGVDLDVDALRAVHAQFTFETMRERAAQVAEVPRNELYRGINDPETLMHPRHVEKGAARDWRSELTPEQIERGFERFAPYADIVPIDGLQATAAEV